jgi:hypothetical protein
MIRNGEAGSQLVQLFYQKIFRHSSTLFNAQESISTGTLSREKTSDFSSASQSHIDLCRRTVAMILASVSDNNNYYSQETWLTLIKVLIGICDTLLKTHKQVKQKDELENNDGSIIADNLAPDLIHVCSIILKSGDF